MAFNPQSHIICVVGGKGGVGKSVFSANLAVTLTKELRTPSLLIDADALTCGDQNIILGLNPHKTLGEIAQFTGQISKQTISTLVSKHQSGIGFIGAVRSPSENLTVEPSLITRPLQSLSHFFRYIVAKTRSS